jgi:23S rRNA pseudouridine2605 synthase
MIKRAVVLAPARGYVDGRFIGEEKESNDALGGRKGRGKSGGRGKQSDSILGDNIGNTTRKKRSGGKGKPRGQGGEQKRADGRSEGGGRNRQAPSVLGQDANSARRGKRKGPPSGDPRSVAAVGGPAGSGAGARGGNTRGRDGAGQGGRRRKGSTGKNTPFRTAPAAVMSPTQSSDLRRQGDEAKSGQFAEALAASASIKRERLHKVLAQSGHGSRRDMEIMIASGRVMVNGIVATAGTQVAPGDKVLVDQRHVKLKFSEDLPRVLLYHKPEGEIVTTSDPGNRITVFDNLPRVENGKWVAVGRLDINTSGLLIFTTSGELANRFMHPRYEVEREYAVRILGELTEEQTQTLLTGVKIEANDDDDDRFNRVDAPTLDVQEDEEEFADDDLPVMEEPAAPRVAFDDDDEDRQPLFDVPAPSVPASAPFVRDPLARFDVIEKRGGEGANQWYHVVIREGRNREVRKMFESQGLTVSRLIRTRFGKVELPPRLTRGKMVELSPDQVRSVLASAGMNVEGAKAPLEGRPQHGPRGPRGEGAVRERGSAPPLGMEDRGGGDARRRRGKRPRNDIAGAPVAIDGNAPLSEGGAELAGTMPMENAPADRNGPRDGANKNRRRSRRGRARTGPAMPGGERGETGSPSAVSGSAEDAGNRVSAAGEPNGPQANPDNRPRGKSRRTFRGRRRNGPPKAGGEGGGNGGNGGNGGGNAGGGGDDFGNR